jgi:hypothetical protein
MRYLAILLGMVFLFSNSVVAQEAKGANAKEEPPIVVMAIMSTTGQTDMVPSTGITANGERYAMTMPRNTTQATLQIYVNKGTVIENPDALVSGEYCDSFASSNISGSLNYEIREMGFNNAETRAANQPWYEIADDTLYTGNISTACD